jgi:hypothetical protein
MNYTVLWKPAAQQELAHLWINAADRSALAAAADLIDLLLKTDPHSQGESRFGDMRILIRPPLAVNFKVSEPDRTVLVSDVWLWGPPP